MPIDQSNATLEFYKSHPKAMKAGLTDEEILERHAKLPPMQQWNIESSAKAAARGRNMADKLKEMQGGPRSEENGSIILMWNEKPKPRGEGSRDDIEAGIKMGETGFPTDGPDPIPLGTFSTPGTGKDPLNLRDPEVRRTGKNKQEIESGWLNQPTYQSRADGATMHPSPKKRDDAMTEWAQRLAIDINNVTGDSDFASLSAKYTLDKWRGRLTEEEYGAKMGALADEFYSRQHKLANSGSIFDTDVPRTSIGVAQD